MDASFESDVAAARAFSRFYTRLVGVLDEGMLNTGFTLTEARVLYELAQRDGQSARDLARNLSLDPGYLSRILKKFEKDGLLAKQTSAGDARRSDLTLTGRGHDAFEPLNRNSRKQMSNLLQPLSPGQRAALVKSMGTIERLLGDQGDSREPYVIRPHEPGDMGWIVHRQAVLYATEYGWDETFEALVAEIASDFIKNHDPKNERCWIAERNGEILGSVSLVRASQDAAKLRMLYVEAAARGLGLGNRLVEECIRFARQCGYKTVTLWTNDCLDSARKIYQAAGFKLVAEEKHRSFGKDLIGQNWELTLSDS